MVMSILSYINERKNPRLCSNLISRYRQNGDKIRLGFDDIQIYFVKSTLSLVIYILYASQDAITLLQFWFCKDIHYALKAAMTL